MVRISFGDHHFTHVVWLLLGHLRFECRDQLCDVVQAWLSKLGHASSENSFYAFLAMPVVLLWESW